MRDRPALALLVLIAPAACGIAVADGDARAVGAVIATYVAGVLCMILAGVSGLADDDDDHTPRYP